MTPPPESTPERRPLRTRDFAASKWLASRLAAVQVSPNGISVAGMLAALLGGLALWGTSFDTPFVRWLFVAGAVLAQLRLLANMLDGMVAIERGVASKVGELFNEVPDRVSDAALLVGLGYAAGGNVALGYCAALAAVLTAYIRAIGKVAGAPQDFGGPMAKPQRMALLTAVALYCAIAPAAWQPTWPGMEHPAGLPAAALAVVAVGSLLTAALRLWRAGRFLQHKA